MYVCVCGDVYLIATTGRRARNGDLCLLLLLLLLGGILNVLLGGGALARIELINETLFGIYRK